MRNSIRARLILVFISLAIGPLLVVGVILAWQSFTSLEQQALISQQEAAKRVSSQVAAFFQELENELRFTVQTQGLEELDQDHRSSVLSNLLAYQSAFDELHLLDSQGQEQVGVYRIGLASTAPVDRSHADEFVIPKTTDQVYYGPVRYDQITNEPLMTIAIPVINLRAGSVDGVLVSAARVKTVWNLIAGIQVSQGQSVYIVDAEGKVVAHRNPSVVLRGTTFAVPKQNGVQPGLSGASAVLAFDTMSLGQQPFSIVAEQTLTEALAPAINTVLVTLVLVVVAVAIAGTLGVLSVRQIVRPIQALAKTAEEISAGNLAAQAQVTSNDEIGTLAANFNSMTVQLRQTLEGLEQRVAERTRELARRSNYLEVTARVARDIAETLELQDLLPRVVNLVSEQFGFYHTGIFLMDASGEWAELKAASSAGGKRMLERGHRLRAEDKGIVGTVAHRGQSRIALDTGADAAFLQNPDLPDTRSEIALPLHVRGPAGRGVSGAVYSDVIGVLDVQSTMPQAFSNEDSAVLQTLADQVALAISNARLFQQAQASLEAERRAYGELGREAWINLLRTRPDLGYRYEQLQVMPVKEMVAEAEHPDGKLPELTLPVKYRGQTFGTLVAHKDANTSEWTSEEIALMKTLTDQLSTALESARLYQDIQRRAARERLAGEITAHMRETLDVETVLRTALDEIYGALDLGEIVVRLATQESSALPRTDGREPERE